jgi:hypothetical protein
MTFGLVLDPPEAPTISGRTMLNLNSGPIRVDQAGIEWGDAIVTQFMAEQGRIGQAPVDYVIPNRTITIPLAVFTDEVSGVTYDQAKRQLQTKVARLQEEGGVLRRTTDTGAYSPIYADIVDAVLSFPDIWGETGQIEVNVRLTLTALPDFYGSEIVLDTVDTTKGAGPGGNPISAHFLQVLTRNSVQAPILGDHPARARIMVTSNGTPSTDFRAIFGGFRSRFYDPASTAALMYETSVLTPAAGATNSTPFAGASNGNVIQFLSLPPNIWTPVLTTDLSGTGALTHKGTYRVFCRCRTNVGDVPGGQTPPTVLRLAWAVGQTVYQVINNPAQLPASANWYIVDLGQVSLQAAPVGSHYWRGTIQAYAPPPSTPARDIYLDALFFVPVDENSWFPTAPAVVVQGVNPLEAWDDFASLAVGAGLNARTAPLGGAWTTIAVSSATDFVGATPPGSSSSGAVQRSTTSDGSTNSMTGRAALHATVFTDTEVGGDFMTTAFPHGPSNSGGLTAGAVARYTNSSNYLYFGYFYFYGTPFVGLLQYVANALTNLGSVKIAELPNTWVTIDLKVTAAGQAYGAVSLQGQSQSPLWTCSGQNAALATGGALASGQVGIVDGNPYTGAATRYYDNVFARNPVTSIKDAVIFGSQQAELRYDGFFRYDQSGSGASPMTRRQGDYARIPVSGLENRPVEMLLGTSAGDLVSLPDSAVKPVLVQVRYRPCWLLAQ